MGISTKETGWAVRYPDLGTGPVPTEPNISPEYFERERERIFKRSWLSVGRVEEISKAGSFFVREIEILKTSIVIVRGQDGVIRGLHNVCQHRGNKVVTGSCGLAHAFTCGFHGWTYGFDGRLICVPDEDQFTGLNKSELGLKPIATDVWEGFIFVNADPHPAETLQEWMGELVEELEGYPFGSMERVATYEAHLNVNWKICVDVTQETYHVPFVHQRSVPDSNTGRENPFCHFLSLKLYKRHRRASVYANPHHKPTPAEAIAFKYGPTVLQGVAGKDALPKGVNPDRSPYWAFDVVSIFPNMIILLGNGWYLTHRYWPIAIDRTLWETTFDMKRAMNAGERIGQEFSRVLNRDLLREDFGTLELVQKGLASGVLSHMELSDQEILLRHNYKVVEECVRS